MELILYMIVCFLQPICWPLPEMSTVLYGTIRFGPNTAFWIAYIFILLGIATIYKATFYLSERYLKKLKKKKNFKKYQKYIKKNEILTTGILFILPILPDEIICMAAAIMGIKFKSLIIVAIFSKFISISLIAYSKQFSEIFNISQIKIIIFQLLIIFLLSIIYDKYQEKKLKKVN